VSTSARVIQSGGAKPRISPRGMVDRQTYSYSSAIMLAISPLQPV
jgi:hypothetical protein